MRRKYQRVINFHEKYTFTQIFKILINEERVSLIGDIGKVPKESTVDFFRALEFNPKLELTVETYTDSFFKKFKKDPIKLPKSSKEYFNEKEIKILQESDFNLKYYPGFTLNYANLDGINDMYLHSSDNEDSFENVVITKEFDTTQYFKTLLEPFETLKKYNLDKKMYFVLIFKDKHIKSDFIYSKAFKWFLEKTKGINILIECSDTNVKDLLNKSKELRTKYSLTIRSK